MNTIWECVKVWLFMGAVGAGLAAAGLVAVHAPRLARGLLAYEKQLRRTR
jgi:hypothetical protein